MKDILRQIRTDLRLSMSGAVSSSMRNKGIKYKIIFGVDTPEINRIAQKYSPERSLAETLWGEKVNARFAEIGHQVTSIHRFINPIDAIENADAIVVGGGNTWQLVKMLHDKGLMKAIRKRVKKGTPYIGWSAGSNIACPTLKTTNDMPIVEPSSFKTLKLVPFQINPHYLDDNPSNHGGETREVRINEFIEANQNTYVVGLREGTMLLLDQNDLVMLGNRNARIFKFGEDPKELSNEDNFNFLMQ